MRKETLPQLSLVNVLDHAGARVAIHHDVDQSLNLLARSELALFSTSAVANLALVAVLDALMEMKLLARNLLAAAEFLACVVARVIRKALIFIHSLATATILGFPMAHFDPSVPNVFVAPSCYAVRPVIGALGVAPDVLPIFSEGPVHAHGPIVALDVHTLGLSLARVFAFSRLLCAISGLADCESGCENG